MSIQNTLSRREVVSLLGVMTASVAATASAQSAGAPSPEVIGSATSTRLHYVFGYGSLIERESRMGTWPSAEFASPVVVKSIARGWFDQADVPSLTATFLGGVPEEGAECNGVIFPVTSAELDSYTRREIGYKATKIEPSRLTVLDGGAIPPDAEIWYFANTRKRFASAERPIVQSYVDVCLNGCLEIEGMYPRAKQANFAEQFIRTTANWGPPWINDRIYPHRPFVYVPRAFAIDALLKKVLGQEMFAQITLK